MHIAVIVPAFNVAPFLRDTILSLVDQTHSDWSAAVVDDGSTDATAAVAASFGDPRISLIQQPNAGVSAARNVGIAMCLAGRSAALQPDAFLFLDGDDWLAPQALEVLAETLDYAPQAVAACGRYQRVAASGARHDSPPPPGGCLLVPLLTRNLFANGGHLLIRRQAIEIAGPFHPGLSYGEDWEYWTRLALVGEFAAVRSRAPVLFVRERPGSAYLAQASNPAAYRPVIEAIYRNPALWYRLGLARLDMLRARAEAEVAWTVGRELIRHGQTGAGRRWLVRSIGASPSLKRLGLVSLSLLKAGPFRRYQSAT